MVVTPAYAFFACLMGEGRYMKAASMEGGRGKAERASHVSCVAHEVVAAWQGSRS